MLDPDDNGAYGLWDGVTQFGYPTAVSVAQGVRDALPDVCDADIVITNRQSSASPPGRAARAAQMSGADLSVTLSMNGLLGSPWGIQSDGGSSAFTTPRADNLALGSELLNQLHGFTGRPGEPVNEGPTNGTVYPYPEFTAVEGTYAQIFMLYMDHNYDWPVIQTRRDLLVNAVVTALGRTLQAKGFRCLGHFPARPSAAELLRLRNLGYQNFQRYGADPISMSTGNFTTSEQLFTLPGLGQQAIDLTLNYNAQSGQDSPVGVGWQFPFTAAFQQYRDGSATVSLDDGRTYLFAANDAGGFDAPAGAFASLTQTDSDSFRWASTTGETLLFDQDSSGRGLLTQAADRQGRALTLTYGPSGSRFPRLSAITDQAGQRVTVTTNAEGRITEFTRPDGASWQLAYSPSGDLLSLTTPRGTTRKFGYDDQHRMTSQVAQDGVTFIVNEYDAQSRVVRQLNAFGQQRTLVYDDGERTTTYTDATGATTVYHWDSLRQVTQVDDALGGTTKTGYDDKFHPVRDVNQLEHATTYTYDATSGQRSAVTDPLGHVVSATFNTAGDMTSITDQGGPSDSARTTKFTLNDEGLPTTITNPDGSTQTRTYNANGDVIAAADEAGAITRFSYDGRGNQLTITDPLGRVTRMTYDLANRLTSTTDPAGRTTTYDYDANDNLIRTTYPNGATDRFVYDVNDQLVSKTDRRGAVTHYEYDVELNLVAVTQPNGGVWRYTFDNENRPLSETNPLGHTTIFKLDALGRRTAVTDANGHTTRTVYDRAGRVVSEIDATGATTTFERDANGRPLKVTDAAGGTIVHEWDAVGRLRSRTDPLGHKTSYTYNFRDQVVTAVDPAGHVTKNEYDVAGRLIRSTDAAGAVTTFEYDDAGQQITTTDALGHRTTRAYDRAGNVTAVTDPLGHITRTAYNAMNEPIARTDGEGRTWRSERDAGGLVTAELNPVGDRTTHTYDGLGNRTSTTDAVGRTTRFTYDLAGREIRETAADGVVTARALDAVGNLVGVTRNSRPGEGATASVNVTTAYAYDARNLLASITDANGHQTTLTRDARGLLTRRTDPLGRSTVFSYDLGGQRTSRIDGNGRETMYDYDPRGLLLAKRYDDGSRDDFTYDAVGRQVTAANGVGTVTTAYDLLGRPTQVTDAAGKTLRYAYDAASNRRQMTLPDGREIGYTYDAADALSAMTSPLGSVRLAYDGAARPVKLERPNGTATTMAYSPADEVTSLATTAGTTTLASLKYTYDSVGNVASRAQTIERVTTSTTYTYDPLRRLTRSAGGPLPSNYTYDGVGNRLTWSAVDDPTTPKPADSFVQTNVFDAASQLTTSTKRRSNGNATFTDVTTYSHDANGNRTLASSVAQAPGHSAATAYTYDLENRLRTSAPTGDRDSRGNGNGQRETARAYDALGRLVTDTRGTTITTWTLDGLDPIVASDLDDTTLYLRSSNGRLLGEKTDDNDAAWYVSDLLGSVLGATTATAKVTGATVYSDYGVNLGSADFRVGFGGELADPLKPGNGIGNDTPPLNHYYARGYEPLSGAWLQRDPYPGALDNPGTQAPYTFAGQKPSTSVDRLGFLEVEPLQAWSVSLQGGVGATYLQGSSIVLQGSNVQIQGGATSSLQPAAGSSILYSGNGYRAPAAYTRVRSSTGTYLENLGVALDVSGSTARGIRIQASVFGSQLRTSDVPQIRSTAGRLLPGAGRLAQNPLIRGGSRVAPVAGIVLDGVAGRANGESWERIGAKATGSTIGGSIGAGIGGLACGTATAATLGLGAATCPVFVGGLGAAGSWVGKTTGGWIADIRGW